MALGRVELVEWLCNQVVGNFPSSKVVVVPLLYLWAGFRQQASIVTNFQKSAGLRTTMDLIRYTQCPVLNIYSAGESKALYGVGVEDSTNAHDRLPY